MDNDSLASCCSVAGYSSCPAQALESDAVVVGRVSILEMAEFERASLEVQSTNCRCAFDL